MYQKRFGQPAWGWPNLHSSDPKRLPLDELTDSLMRAERPLRVELRAPARVRLDDLNRLNPGRVEREELLNANAVALTRHGEVARDVLAAVVNRENLVNTRQVKLEVLFLHLGVMPPENLKELAIAGAALIRRDNTIGRVVCATRTTHSNLYHLLSSFFRLMNWRVLYHIVRRGARGYQINESSAGGQSAALDSASPSLASGAT